MSVSTKFTTPVNKAISENPFYGMSATFTLFSELPKLQDNTPESSIFGTLDAAWKECSVSLEKRQLFMSLLFSIGDITNREHNIFRKKKLKVEGGGHAKRRLFYVVLKWLLQKQPSQYYKFLPIIGEYYNLDGTMLYELKTDRLKGTLLETRHLQIDVEKVTSYIASVLTNSKTTDNEKFLWAKWLPHIPISTHRVRTYKITDKNYKAFIKKGNHVELGSVVSVKKSKKEHTLTKDAWVRNFIFVLSKKMGWAVIEYPNNTLYKGYKEFKSKYLANTEAVLFSTKRIVKFDKQQFFNWLDTLPSGARHNTQCRLVYKADGKLVSKKKWVSKYSFDFGEAFIEWLASKEKAQKQLMSLTQKEKEEMKPGELKELKKAAKVNTGATTILDLLVDFFKSGNTTDASVALNAVVEKMNLKVPVLPIVDISESMSSNYFEHNGLKISASKMTGLLTTILLLKNPSEDLKEMFIRFDDIAEVICSGQYAIAHGKNRFIGKSTKIVDNLIDRNKTVWENYQNICQFVISRGSTSLSSVASTLKIWTESEPALKNNRIEQINQYPVFLVISDGDLNNSHDAKSSMLKFQSDMRQYFGWEGVVVLWDVKSAGSSSRFENIPNMIHFSGVNLNIVNQIFTKLDDLDIIDTFISLKTLFLTERYLPVRQLTM